MLERIVDNWLTKVGERGFETPFAQLLAYEGYRLLHGPVHHPFEHGKDIAAYSPNGELCAFQLKGGDIGLADLERIQPQLLALAGTAITYPGVEPPRRPDRVLLVTSGKLSPPARDRLAMFNSGNRQFGFPILECVEKEQLVGRFMDAHGRFWPAEPEELDTLLHLYVNEGTGTFPVTKFSAFISTIILPDDETRRTSAISRSLASAVLLTAYAAAAWQRKENHLAVGEAWLTLCASILFAAAKFQLSDEVWAASYQLAFSEARGEFALLVEEARTAEDLLIPDLVDGAVYPSRVLLVCGFIATFFLSEHILGEAAEKADIVRQLLTRELSFLKVSGESAAPAILSLGAALDLLDEQQTGRTLVYHYAAELADANQLRSDHALPDPYHDIDDVLRRTYGADSDSASESFNGRAYTLHLAIDWLARRGERDAIAAIWPNVTKLTLQEFSVSAPALLLAPHDDAGRLVMWHAATPESWQRLVSSSATVNESELPTVLWRHLEFLPYLLMLFPYRLIRATERALEYALTGAVSVNLDLSDDNL